MACNCTKRLSRQTYVWSGPGGVTKVVSSEVEARALVATKGGSYKIQG